MHPSGLSYLGTEQLRHTSPFCHAISDLGTSCPNVIADARGFLSVLVHPVFIPPRYCVAEIGTWRSIYRSLEPFGHSTVAARGGNISVIVKFLLEFFFS